MSTNSITASTQPIQNVQSAEVVERLDATNERIDDVAIRLFQQIMLLPSIQEMFAFADECEVVQLTEGHFVIIGEGQGEPFYCEILVSIESNEEVEPFESVDSSPFIEEVSDSEEAFAAATAIVAPEPIPVAS